MNKPFSLIHCSEQIWKLWVFYFSAIAGTAWTIIVAALKVGTTHIQNDVLQLLGMGLVLGGFAFMCTSVKCPKCGARWFWIAMKEQPFKRFEKWTFSLQECPTCGVTCNEMRLMRNESRRLN